MKRPQFVIGIDSGTNTGIAIWSTEFKTFISLQSLPIHKAIEVVTTYRDKDILVIVEDARQVRFKTEPAKAQGAGYVKAHAQIWEAYLKDKGIRHEMKRPNKALTKWDAKRFQLQTNWTGQTNEHMRDAGLLCFGF